MRFTRVLAATAATVLLATAGCAQEAANEEAGEKAAAGFPEKSKSITFIVPYSAGGPADSQARVAATLLEKELGARVLVLNKPGGNTVVGLTELANAKPDGYTFGMISMPNALAWIWPGQNAPYKKESFTWFSSLSDITDVVAVNADSPYQSMADLVAAAKAKPGQLIASIEGAQSTDNLAITNLEKAAGIDLKTAIYATGAAEKVAALLGKQIDVATLTVATAKPQVDAGKFRILATLSKEPISQYPQVPTVASLGYDVTSETYYTVVVPAGTPDAIRSTLEAAMMKVGASSEYQEKISALGLTPKTRSAAEVTALVPEVEARTTESLQRLGAS
ncbi:tripartite tricarboxylate transporter substrate binding protein [Phytohabitans kaempferiae]|uniref:Tripartite tricarboxylate transporter substrate binding protein n=1 Tax=Phytohabitans kaempferiae TaxID=1620943 RepID=A0ABV6MI73_9ACTN